MLRLFADLVDDYDSLCAAFPIDRSVHELLDGQPVSETQRWHRTVRVLAVRKFVLPRQDAVRVDRVIAALERCHAAPLEDPAINKANHAFDEIRERFGECVDVLEDILYGVFLHGEYERYLRDRARDELTKDLALLAFGESAEFLVRNLRYAIRTAAREGRLNAEATASLAPS